MITVIKLFCIHTNWIVVSSFFVTKTKLLFHNLQVPFQQLDTVINTMQSSSLLLWLYLHRDQYFINAKGLLWRIRYFNSNIPRNGFHLNASREGGGSPAQGEVNGWFMSPQGGRGQCLAASHNSHLPPLTTHYHLHKHIEPKVRRAKTDARCDALCTFVTSSV